jgi:hypothetical protein
MDRPYGDPRDPNADAADRLESIPFSLARNNVQQVMKNCSSIAPLRRPVTAADRGWSAPRRDGGMSEANREWRVANGQRGSLWRRTFASVRWPVPF